MVDYLTFVRCMEKRGAKDLPKEMSGLALALFLRENPDRFYWRGDTCYIWDSVNYKFLYCKPFNKKHIFWYSANGLQQSYNTYRTMQAPIVKFIRKDDCNSCIFKRIVGEFDSEELPF